MSVTLLGLPIIALCVFLLLRGNPLSLLSAVMLLSLMGGSAAVFLTALGGASVRPALLAMVFLSAAVVAPGASRASLLPYAAARSWPIIFFSVYGFIAAMILPNLFIGEIELVPMNPRVLSGQSDVAPLSFTNQNITTGIYLLATMMAVIASFTAAQHKNAPQTVFWSAVAVCAIHLFLGVTDALFANTPYEDFLDFFRNANYAQHDQSISGIARINGIFPETSAYAGYGLPWMVLMSELWLRGVVPRITGVLALLLFAVLALSLSSTAVVGVGAYCVLIGLRAVLLPGSIPARKLAHIALAGFSCFIGIFVFIIVNPSIVDTYTDIMARLTIEKASSDSGLKRATWARQGIDAFIATYGIGVGPGSFRSSSSITAILGSIGVIGIVMYLAFLAAVLKPLSAATYYKARDVKSDLGAAFSWAAFSTVIPASIASPSPDPGILFGMLSGIALAFRNAAYPAFVRQE